MSQREQARMKNAERNTHDGSRQRCTGCGHPREEHRSVDCTVPNCPCPKYAAAIVGKPAKEATA